MPIDPRPELLKRAARPAKIYDAIMGWLADKKERAGERMGPAEEAVSGFAEGAADKARTLIGKLTS
jgi:hypothetical protein